MYFTFKTHLKLLRLLDSCDFAKENSWGAKQTSEKSGSPEKADGTAAAAGWQGCLAQTNFGSICAGARHFVVHQTVEQRSEFESR